VVTAEGTVFKGLLRGQCAPGLIELRLQARDGGGMIAHDDASSPAWHFGQLPLVLEQQLQLERDREARR